jgi:GntR family transcriptional regulator
MKLYILLDIFCCGQMKINRDAPIPAYYQIAFDLRHRIDNGEWRSKNRLPPEKNLACEYGVSRMTMRQAIGELVKDGFLSRQRGSGTYINHNTTHVVPRLSFPISFTLRIKELGLTPSANILKAQIIQFPPTEIARYLNIDPCDSVAYYKLNHSFIPYNLCPGIIDEGLIDNSISSTLEGRYHLTPIYAEHWFEAVLASDEDASMLDTDPGNPLLLLTTLSYLENKLPLEFSMTSWVGNRMRFYVQATVEPLVSVREIQYKQ